MMLRVLVLVVTFCLGAVEGRAEVRPEVARLLPPDAVVVGGLDLQALRETPLFSRLASHFPLERDAQLDQIFAAAGFDPKRDIHRLLAAGEGRLDGTAKATLFVIEGRFDLDGQGSVLREMFRRVGEHGGFPLYENVGGRADPDSTFAFLDPQTVVMGRLDLVQSAIDRWSQPDEPSQPERTALAQGAAHMWAASFKPESIIGPLAEMIPGGGGPFRAIAASMQSVVARAKAVAGGVNAEFAFRCADATDARSLADAVQALTAFAALTAQHDQPGLAAWAGKLQIRQNEDETTLSIEIPEAQLLSLRKR
jgi:hypothetical protein